MFFFNSEVKSKSGYHGGSDRRQYQTASFDTEGLLVLNENANIIELSKEDNQPRTGVHKTAGRCSHVEILVQKEMDKKWR